MSLAGGVILWKKLCLSLSPGSFSEGVSSMRWRVDRQVLSARSNGVDMEHLDHGRSQRWKSCKRRNRDSGSSSIKTLLISPHGGHLWSCTCKSHPVGRENTALHAHTNLHSARRHDKMRQSLLKRKYNNLKRTGNFDGIKAVKP
ncbi:hypothetical protein CRENBAI_020053 [Crenichthys baileyi]|uniref:C2H2-type domain-containing protein n=1 Tax=Crenichthys baileyi TaxID=28760 RepID=A0AAV9RQG1_9TELE